jgi:hypothetical protein
MFLFTFIFRIPAAKRAYLQTVIQLDSAIDA